MESSLHEWSTCVSCGQPVMFDVRGGVWRHLGELPRQNVGPADHAHEATPQKKVA